MGRNEDIALAIRQRDIDAISRLMFQGSPPSPRSSFRTETELWDYKGECPEPGKQNAVQWAEIAVDVLAFHNQGGGILVFGIRDSDFSFSGAMIRLDSKMINDQLRGFLSDRIWVEFHRLFIQSDQRYLGLALVPPRGPVLERFQAAAPILNGSQRFRPAILQFAIMIRLACSKYQKPTSMLGSRRFPVWGEYMPSMSLFSES